MAEPISAPVAKGIQRRDKIVLAKERLEGLDVLRLLGNDAAHVRREPLTRSA